MRKVREIYDYINELYPFCTQESWDNAGLLIGSLDDEIDKAVLSLDITADAANEAGALGAGLVISHHPIIFNAIKRVPKNSAVYAVAKNNLSAICAHTNMDMGVGGVNDELFSRLQLTEKRPLSIAASKSYKQVSVYVPASHADEVYGAMAKAGAGAYDGYEGCAFLSSGEGRFVPQDGAKPFLGSIGECAIADERRITMLVSPKALKKVVNAMLAAHPYEVPSYEITDNHAVTEDIPMGLVGQLSEPMDSEHFARHVKNCLGLDGVKLYGESYCIRTVGLCSGSGGSLLSDAIACKCDAMVTGDVRHDVALEAIAQGLVLVDAGHYGTENIIIEPLKIKLAEKFPDVEFIVSESGKMKYKTV